MNNKKFIPSILFLATCLLHLTVIAQTPDFDNYKILMSTGQLPINLEDAMKDDLANNNQSNKSSRAKRDEKNFIIKSTYSLDKLLRGGAVIYNDPVGAYLSKVLNHVLQSNGIEDEVTVYFIRSEEVNAYAMDKNYIFLTAGLFSQVTSEAQLAMILSHEYIHYKNKHSRTEYHENMSIVRDYKNYKTSSTDARFLIANFSRELETEADKQGFEMYEAANYSYNGAIEAFEVLKYSHLPFEEIKFEKTFLESNDLKFPKDYFLDEITPVQDGDKKDDDDKYRTHPHIDSRIVDMQELTEGKSNAGRKDFIISKEDFFTFRKLARYEVCRLFLIDRNYEEALYSAYLLLQENPNSQYLQKVVLKSLYGLTKFSNANKFSKVHSSYKKKQGESQQVYFFIDALSKKELNYTAIHYAWKLHEKYPDDGDVTFILHDLVYEACKNNKLTPFNLKTEHPDTGVVMVNTNDSASVDTSQNKNNKYTKIKSDTDTDNKKKTKKKTNNFIEYAFVEIQKNNEFKNLLKEEYKKWEDKQAADAEAIKNRRNKKQKYTDDQIDETRNIDAMLVLNPVIMKIDTRKSENKIYNATNNKRKEMIDNFVKLTKKTGITSNVFNPVDLSENDVDKFNEMFLLNTAMYEMLSLPDRVEMLPTDNLDLKNIALNHETNYLANIGVVTFVEKKYGVALAVMMGVVTMGFLLPYTIYVLAKPNVSTVVYLNVYDVEQSKFVFSDVTEVKSGGTQDLMGSVLYDMILKMKTKKKK